jgi:hypothetical protein
MKLNIFKSILSYYKKQKELTIKNKKIAYHVNLQIDNQSYDAILEYMKNGFKLNETQTIELFFSCYYLRPDKVSKRKCDTDKWINFIKNATQYDASFTLKMVKMMTEILSDHHNLIKFWPYAGGQYNLFRMQSYSLPANENESNWCYQFVSSFQKEILAYTSIDKLNVIRKNLPHLYLDDDSKLIIKNLCQLLDSMTEKENNLKEKQILEDIKTIYHKTEIKDNEKMKTSNNITNDTLNTMTTSLDQLPEELKVDMFNLLKLISSINSNALNETQKLEFDNLVVEKLPLIIQSYLEVDINLRAKIVNHDSANNLFKENLSHISELLNSIKKELNENQLEKNLNKLKIHNKYLKSKL